MTRTPEKALSFEQMCLLGPVIHHLLDLLKGKKKPEADSGRQFVEVVEHRRKATTKYELAYLGFKKYEDFFQQKLIKWADDHKEDYLSKAAKDQFYEIIGLANNCSSRTNLYQKQNDSYQNSNSLSDRATNRDKSGNKVGHYGNKGLRGLQGTAPLDRSALKRAEAKRMEMFSTAPKETFTPIKIAEPLGTREDYKRELGRNKFNGR